MELAKYLAQLNSAETQWGFWVNPDNTDEYRIGQYCFENGGLADEWVHIGTLEGLSFGFQSEHDAFACWASNGRSSERMPNAPQVIDWNGRKVAIAPEALYEAWCEGRLHKPFADFVAEKVGEIQALWSEIEAQDFVQEELPVILAAAQEEAA